MLINSSELNFIKKYTSTQTEGEIAILLSTPRVGSTAVLMSMKDTGRVLFNEPGIRPYQHQFEPDLIQGEKEVADIQPQTFQTFHSVLAAVNRELKRDKNIFIKEMVFAGKHYVQDPIFMSAAYFFLLRSPEESIISNYKLCPNPVDSVLHEILGQEQTLKLCLELKNLRRSVYFIKSEDLQKNPRVEIERLCQLARIPFKESMLQWKPLDNSLNKVSEYFHVLPNWHDKAARSSGFDAGKFSNIDRIDGKPTFKEIPENHRQAYIEFYNAQLPHYQELLKLAAQDLELRPTLGVKSKL